MNMLNLKYLVLKKNAYQNADFNEIQIYWDYVCFVKWYLEWNIIKDISSVYNEKIKVLPGCKL